jgi:hypothetical protein
VRWAKGDQLAACEARVGAQLLLCDDLVSGLGVVADNLSRERTILVRTSTVAPKELFGGERRGAEAEQIDGTYADVVKLHVGR